ncbi:MAG: ATP-binding protein, partial [Candidatus Saccharibacteria bacterium]|nr:ATP-binding protein [Candidatus Saccharibacteria bacterium]
MSIAGIRSNRGDGYQTLVAMDWAITVIANPDFEWIEIDSIIYPVDDVVIGRSDGSLICCQCKKNQTDFKAWTISDLADELHKAVELIKNNSLADIRFYSRSPFGVLHKLQEFSETQGTELEYRSNLTKEHAGVDAELAELLSKISSLSTFDFLKKATFQISDDFDRMEMLLHERLNGLAAHAKNAFAILYRRLDALGSRMKTSDGKSASHQHRLSKNDLKLLLNQAGAMLSPSMDVGDARESLSKTSVIGRVWRRDIAGERIQHPVEEKLLAAIDNKEKSILLTGLPGSGKTCVLLAVQDALETQAKYQSGVVPLFIQSREFADLSTSHEREELGLSENWVEKAARLSEKNHVVIIIDSLDVLSIAREHTALSYFLSQIDQLLLIPNITVVTACRDFDHKYDRRIAERQWDAQLSCGQLNWLSHVEPILTRLSISTGNIDSITRELILNPRELDLFVELALKDGSFNVVTSQALAQKYLNTIVRDDNLMGDEA